MSQKMHLSLCRKHPRPGWKNSGIHRRDRIKMIGSELYFSLFVGVILSLIFAEKFGINPAGLVVPGYLALILINP